MGAEGEVRVVVFFRWDLEVNPLLPEGSRVPGEIHSGEKRRGQWVS